MSDLPGGAGGADDLEFEPDLDDGAVEDPDLDIEADDGEEPEPEVAEDGEEGEEPEPRPQRQGRRTQTQRQREKIANLEREIAEIRARQSQPAPMQQPQFDAAAQARAAEEERRALEMMSPLEQSQYFYQKGMQQTQQAMFAQQHQIQDRIDKQAYDQQAANSRVHRAYQQRVESLLASERARGNYGADRSTILAYLVGQDAISRANGAAPRQRAQAARRVAAATTRPSSGRGDGVRTGARNQDDADDRLLRGIRASDL